MSSLGKRASSWVDLTGSDDENPASQPKQVRVATSQSASGSQPRPSQSLNARDTWGEADEEEEIIDLSQDVDEGFGWVCVGAILDKIVGVRFYTGYATMGEQVMIKREAVGNRYSSPNLNKANFETGKSV
jgi:SWI/SNF-related matrix-associated actin-dependent regulator of chromatin subfamily A3